jgi:hypothetical protein
MHVNRFFVFVHDGGVSEYVRRPDLGWALRRNLHRGDAESIENNKRDDSVFSA